VSREILVRLVLLVLLVRKALRATKEIREILEAKDLKVFKVKLERLVLSVLLALLVSTGVALGLATLTMWTTMLSITTTRLGLLQATPHKVKHLP
jgi:hypothetical protein